MGDDSRSPGLSPVQAEATWRVTGAGRPRGRASAIAIPQAFGSQDVCN